MSNTGRRSALVIVLLTLVVLFWWQVLPDADERTVDIGPTPEPGWMVDAVIDGDTITVTRGGVGETVRLIGIDTPERGRCGYDEAPAPLRGVRRP
jgi:endonuclease YncB( thermonuclease family)